LTRKGGNRADGDAFDVSGYIACEVVNQCRNFTSRVL
jgi:hypothetical protein